VVIFCEVCVVCGVVDGLQFLSGGIGVDWEGKGLRDWGLRFAVAE